MIIDSHAHYAHKRFDTEFPYLLSEDEGYTFAHSDRESLIDELKQNGIVGVIEPSIGFDDIEKQLAIVEEHSECMWAAVGVHPTRTFRTKWKNRKMLARAIERSKAVAVGEAGLDYHYPRMQQHRICQKAWFVYQIKLADSYKLPLVLHIRRADKDALRILRRYKKRLHGGVAHCFSSDVTAAKEYIDLGFVLGIGGYLLYDNELGKRLQEVVRSVPLSAILVETDAPFVLPDIGDELDCSRNQRRKLCNSSLILPAVIKKIAELRGEKYEDAEEAIYQNTIRTFRLNEGENR